MAAALVTPTELQVGALLTVTGTGWHIDEAVTISIENPEESEVVTFKAVADHVTGNWDMAVAGTFKAVHPGVWTVHASGVNTGTKTNTVEITT